MIRKKRVLVAPLDWGLGHATRSMAIINELVRQNAEVVIGADNRPYDLLRKEFPHLEHMRLQGYAVRYSDTHAQTKAILVQIPSILKGFRKENELLDKIIAQHKIDAVISDSRFGLHSKKIPAVFVIHQLDIILPAWLGWSRGIVRSTVKALCNKYSEVWIPDFQGATNLAGALSHPNILPQNAHYIGPLTRLERMAAEKTIDILVILSGPEPQRTMLENILLDQVTKTSLVAVIARGKPEQTTTMKVSPKITMFNSVQRHELSQMIASANIVVSRPGFSTIMDLAHLGAKAIFIPTPQQSEQEYLAAELLRKQVCYCEPQHEFNLQRALQRSTEFSGFSAMEYDPSVLQQRVHNLLNNIQ